MDFLFWFKWFFLFQSFNKENFQQLVFLNKKSNLPDC